MNLLSSAFSLAVLYDKAEFNPCSKVDLFPLDNLRYRYLLPEEEPRLMAELSGPRAHLRPALIVALGTGSVLKDPKNGFAGEFDLTPWANRIRVDDQNTPTITKVPPELVKQLREEV